MKILKTVCLALVCLILPCAAASADLPMEVTALLTAHYPGYTVAAQAGGGSNAQGQIALVLSKDGRNVLCIAEKVPGDAGYTFTVETDAAVRQGDDIPDLLIDSAGDVLFYTYHDANYDYRYHAEKTRDGWGNVDILRISPGEKHHEDTLFFQRDTLQINEVFYDGNDNFIYQDSILPLYAPWLETAFRLQAFDITAWDMDNYSDLYAMSAQSILGDGYMVSMAKATPYMLLADAADAQGVRFLFLMELLPDGTYQITRSSPMGEGVRPDFVHAWSDIGIRIYPDFAVQENYGIYGFEKRTDGLWHLSGVMTGDDIFSYTVYGLRSDTDTWRIGDTPEVELTTVDWAALPKSLAETLETLDQSGWARVKSDDPNNRLHLRAKPDTNAASLGKYYQGTPVKVLGTSGDWTEVDIFGVHGYMMTRWLAFGADMNNVEIATLWRTYKGDALAAGIPVYASPSDSVPIATLTASRSLPDPYILGVAMGTNGSTSCSRKPACPATSGRIRSGREMDEWQ